MVRSAEAAKAYLSAAALFEEPIQRGGGYRRLVFAGRQSQFAQQRGAGAMWIFTFEAFDEIGKLRGDGA